MKEVWKDIQSYEGLYQISNLGRVKSLEKYVTERNGKVRIKKESILSEVEHTHGYKTVCLCNGIDKKRHYIHRIVLAAFAENSDAKETVNHKDGNKANNRIDNLEWATYAENNCHARKIGLVSENKNSKAITLINLKTQEEISFNSQSATSRFLGKSRNYICDVLQSGNMTVCGYRIAASSGQ